MEEATMASQGRRNLLKSSVAIATGAALFATLRAEAASTLASSFLKVQS